MLRHELSVVRTDSSEFTAHPSGGPRASRSVSRQLSAEHCQFVDRAIPTGRSAIRDPNPEFLATDEAQIGRDRAAALCGLVLSGPLSVHIQLDLVARVPHRDEMMPVPIGHDRTNHLRGNAELAAVFANQEGKPGILNREHDVGAAVAAVAEREDDAVTRRSNPSGERERAVARKAQRRTVTKSYRVSRTRDPHG